MKVFVKIISSPYFIITTATFLMYWMTLLSKYLAFTDFTLLLYSFGK